MKMKKKFIIEIDYNELSNSMGGDVLTSASVERILEILMEGYIETNSIEYWDFVNVEEIE
jgi:hypothetical protein